VRTAVAQLNEHVDPLAARLDALAVRADAVGVDAQDGIVAAKATFESVKALSDTVAASVRPLAASLMQTSEGLQQMTLELEATLARSRVLLDPEAPIAVELRQGLRELAETARATRALFELLERNPSALLRGRGEKEGEPR
jgi:paraquat-inducible protein B